MALWRVTIYTPAVTIVAAWMSAETGVGPAIASGSQTYRGICADLPVAPMKRRTATEVMPPAKIMRHANGSVAIEPIVLSALETIGSMATEPFAWRDRK